MRVVHRRIEMFFDEKVGGSTPGEKPAKPKSVAHAARVLLERLLEAARPHADDLGCADMLDAVVMLGEEPGAKRQRRVAREPGRLLGLVELLSGAFVS